MDSLLGPPRADDGALSLGGLPASELAASYGTPLIVIDTDVLDARIARFTDAATAFEIDAAYAAKALLVTALAARLRDTTLSLDCCSLGELTTAEAAKFPADRIYLHGCGKTADELQAAADGRVARVVVDHLEELGALGAISRIERPISVILRVNTGIEAHTHEFIRTGGENTKFGFPRASLREAIVFALGEPGLRLVGLHSHIGSQIVDVMPFLENLESLMNCYIEAHALGAKDMRDLIVGGGFGVPMHPADTLDRIDPHAVLGEIAARARTAADAAGVPPPRIGVEPGRALIGEAGTTLYRVVAVKSQGSRRFVIVDGGMTDNPRPALYGAYHHPQLASRVSTAKPVQFTVCGRACENDQLVEALLPSDLQAGDLLALRVTGAYTYSMASNYNRFSRPALVFAGGGTHRLVARRETPEELLRYDVV